MVLLRRQTHLFGHDSISSVYVALREVTQMLCEFSAINNLAARFAAKWP